MPMENNASLTVNRKEIDEKEALIELLQNEVIFLNSFWFEDECPDRAKKAIGVFVICNDTFAWGCADGEDLPYDEIGNLYQMWKRDPSWGADVWCMVRRNQMPQKPVEEEIRKAGIWDLDSLKLGENWQDEENTRIIAAAVQAMKKPPQ